MKEERRVCKKCGKEFLILPQEKKFLEERGLPLPEYCPACRQQRRLSLRGERRLYKTTCQECGKTIFVTYNPEEMKSKILCQACFKKFMEKTELVEK